MSVFNAYLSLSGAGDTHVTRDVTLARKTSLRVGGATLLMVSVATAEALARAINVLTRERVPWVVWGRGSSMLVADTGFAGCVIMLDQGSFTRVTFTDKGQVIAGAGASLSRVVNEAMRHGFSGLEPLIGVPGTLGGAVATNAEAHGQGIRTVLRDCVVVRSGQGLYRYTRDELTWEPGSCSLAPGEVIVEVTLALTASTSTEVGEAMERYHVQRQGTQPPANMACLRLFCDPQSASHTSSAASSPLTANDALMACGFSGVLRGDAVLGKDLPNYVVNRGSARAHEVFDLMMRARDTVAAQCGVVLPCAVRLVGFED